MSTDRPDQPELVRKLLGQDDPVQVGNTPAAPATPQAPAVPAARPLIYVDQDDQAYVPHGLDPHATSQEPPRGLRRFGPSVWPWPARTRRARVRNILIVTVAVAGAVAGLLLTWFHLATDPLADAHGYFDAAVRLNQGQPLYPAAADPSAAGVYRYPPLLAVVLRPVALLGWPAFAAIWEAIVVASFVLLLRRLGPGPRTWLALGILAIPAGWALAIGQAQVPLTLLLAIGQPWSIALGANLNLFTALAALWWIGRRDWQATVAFVAWVVLIALAQVVVDLNDSEAFVRTLSADQVGPLLHGSPFAIAPLTWSLLVGLGIIATLASARSRWGWLAAVATTALASLPLLPYRLVGLLAAVREPEIAGLEPPSRPVHPVWYGRR